MKERGGVAVVERDLISVEDENPCVETIQMIKNDTSSYNLVKYSRIRLIECSEPPVNDVSRDFFRLMNHDISFFCFMNRKFWLVIISTGLISGS
jgi:hypothetical protein